MADKPRPELSDDDDDPLDLFTSEGGDSSFAVEDEAFAAEAEPYISYDPAARRSAADWTPSEQPKAQGGVWDQNGSAVLRAPRPYVAPQVAPRKSLSSAGPWAVVLSAGAVVAALLSLPLLIDRLNDESEPSSRISANQPGEASSQLSTPSSPAAAPATTGVPETSAVPRAAAPPPTDARGTESRTPLSPAAAAVPGNILTDARERPLPGTDPRSRETSVAMATSRTPAPAFPAFPIPGRTEVSTPPSSAPAAVAPSTSVPPVTAPATVVTSPVAPPPTAFTPPAAAVPPLNVPDRTSAEDIARVAPPPAAAAPVAVVQTRSRSELIQGVLFSYRDALNARDALATRAVWPTAPMDSLARGFEQVPQKLAFDDCKVTSIYGPKAVASCGGKVTYTRAGQSKETTESHRWEFNLIEIKDSWQIDKIVIR